ncbi:MAG: hypothetical protein ACFFBD_25200 [Candidatus Hodarchaeota archaeon]
MDFQGDNVLNRQMSQNNSFLKTYNTIDGLIWRKFTPKQVSLNLTRLSNKGKFIDYSRFSKIKDSFTLNHPVCNSGKATSLTSQVCFLRNTQEIQTFKTR